MRGSPNTASSSIARTSSHPMFKPRPRVATDHGLGCPNAKNAENRGTHGSKCGFEQIGHTIRPRYQRDRGETKCSTNRSGPFIQHNLVEFLRIFCKSLSCIIGPLRVLQSACSCIRAGPLTAHGPIRSRSAGANDLGAITAPNRMPARPQNLPKLLMIRCPSSTACDIMLCSGHTSQKLSSMTHVWAVKSAAEYRCPSGLFG